MPQNGGTCRTGLPTTLPGFPCGRFMQKAQAKSVLREVITSRSCSRNTFSGCGKGGSPDDEGRACRSRFSAGCGEASGREAARFRAGMACAGPSGAGPRMGWRSPPSIEAGPTFFPCAPGTLRPMPPGSRPLPREPRRVEAAGSITRGNMGHYGAFPGAWKRGGIREAARGRGMGLLIGSAERPMSGNAEGEVPSAGNLREDGRERGYGLADLLEDGLYRAGGHVHDRGRGDHVLVRDVPPLAVDHAGLFPPHAP